MTTAHPTYNVTMIRMAYLQLSSTVRLRQQASTRRELCCRRSSMNTDQFNTGTPFISASASRFLERRRISRDIDACLFLQVELRAPAFAELRVPLSPPGGAAASYPAVERDSPHCARVRLKLSCRMSK